MMIRGVVASLLLATSVAHAGNLPIQITGNTAVAIVKPSTTAVMGVDRIAGGGGAYVTRQSNPGTVAQLYGGGTATTLQITGTAGSGGAVRIGYLGDRLGIGCPATSPFTVCGGAATSGSNAVDITITGQNGGLNGNGGNITFTPGYGAGSGSSGSLRILHQNPTLRFTGQSSDWNINVTGNDFKIRSNTESDLIAINNSTHAASIWLGGSQALGLSSAGDATFAGKIKGPGNSYLLAAGGTEWSVRNAAGSLMGKFIAGTAASQAYYGAYIGPSLVGTVYGSQNDAGTAGLVTIGTDGSKVVLGGAAVVAQGSANDTTMSGRLYFQASGWNMISSGNDIQLMDGPGTELFGMNKSTKSAYVYLNGAQAMNLDSSGNLTAFGALGVQTPTTWANNQTCAAGRLQMDATYIYGCTATNTVKRIPWVAF